MTSPFGRRREVTMLIGIASMREVGGVEVVAGDSGRRSCCL